MGVHWGVVCVAMAVAVAAAPTAFAQEVVIRAGAADTMCQNAGECFDPDAVVVVTYDAVTWRNGDTVTHTVTSGSGFPDGSFHSGFIPPGESFSHTFDASGTYPYYCMVHPHMSGSVSVSDTASWDAPDGTASPFFLNDPRDVTVFWTSGGLYMIESQIFTSSLKIINITSPDDIRTTAEARNGQGGFDALAYPVDTELLVQGDRTYALVAAMGNNAIQIIDVTDPGTIVPVSAIRDDFQGFDYLNEVMDISVYGYPAGQYAFAVSRGDQAIQIVDVTDPASPTPAGEILPPGSSAFRDIHVYGTVGGTYAAVGGSEGVPFGIVDVTSLDAPTWLDSEWRNLDTSRQYVLSDITIFQSSGGVYAAAGSLLGNTLDIMDITDPLAPAVVATVRDGDNGFDALDGANDIEVFWTGGRTYALVVAVDDRALQIVDITNPDMPEAVSVVGSDVLDLPNPYDAEMIPDPVRIYFAVAGDTGDAVRILDLTDPAAPAMIESTRVKSASESLIRDIEIITISGEQYAFVSGFGDGESRILDLSDPANLVTLGVMRDDTPEFAYIRGTVNVYDIESPGKTFVLTSNSVLDVVMIIDVTDPNNPAYAAHVQDGIDGFLSLNTVFDIGVMDYGGERYAFVAALRDNGIQIINITDPYKPTPAGALLDGRAGFDTLAGSSNIEMAESSGKTYAVVAAVRDGGIQVIDTTDPLNPVPVSAATSEQAGFDGLRSVADLDVAALQGGFYALSASLTGAIQITNVTDWYNPAPVAVIRDGERGFEGLAGIHDVELLMLSDKTYVLTTSRPDRTVAIADVTYPDNPTMVYELRGGENGFLASPDDVETFVMDGIPYLVVMDSNGIDIQVVNIASLSAPFVVMP